MSCKFVIKDQLGVAKDGWRHAENSSKSIFLIGNLRIEFLFGEEEGERMMACLANKFARAGLLQFAHGVNHIRRPLFQLVQHGPREGIRNTKAPLMAPDQIQNLFRRRAIALIGNLFQNRCICIIVKIKRVAIKDRILSEPIRLMDLKIDTNCSHGIGESTVSPAIL